MLSTKMIVLIYLFKTLFVGEAVLTSTHNYFFDSK